MRRSFLIAALFIAVLALTCTAKSTDSSVIVNIMVATDMPVSPNEEQIDSFKSSLLNIVNEINPRKANATIFLTQDAASSMAKLLITQIGLSPNLEFAMSGNHTDEMLSTMTYVKQSEILARTQKIAEACYVCNGNTIEVKGFLPQSFDQNEGTYMSLDELGIEYDAGFQTGLLYAPGHENDVWPYKYPNHNFYAVPISSHDLSGEPVFLQDSYLKSKGLSGSQWYDLLVEKFDDAANKGEPMVVLLITSTSGTGDYLDALGKFFDYATNKDARFVSTMELVNMSITGVKEVPVLMGTTEAVNASSSTPCSTCDSTKATIGFGPIENMSAANFTVTAPKLVL